MNLNSKIGSLRCSCMMRTWLELARKKSRSSKQKHSRNTLTLNLEKNQKRNLSNPNASIENGLETQLFAPLFTILKLSFAPNATDSCRSIPLMD
jgi:hypothetical protein